MMTHMKHRRSPEPFGTARPCARNRLARPGPPARPCRRHVRGFTLIEILIVVVIIGVLAAIVIAAFATTPRESRANAARSSLKTVRSQIELYGYRYGLPDTIDVLYDEGFLANRAIAPEGFVYQYNSLTGAFWVECTPENAHCPDDINEW